MARTLLSILLIAAVCFTASAFAPVSRRHTASFSIESSPTVRNINSSYNSFTCLSAGAGPAILDKPETKEEKEISKDAEKESSPSNSKGWAVRLYNDPMNKREFVARCLTEITNLSDGAAYQCMMQAHQFGISVVGQYHLEMAELYRDQLSEQGLLIDMIPVDDDK